MLDGGLRTERQKEGKKERKERRLTGRSEIVRERERERERELKESNRKRIDREQVAD